MKNIEKKIFYGEHEVVLAVFGDGKIELNNTYAFTNEKDEVHVLFKSVEKPQKINRKMNKTYKSVDEFAPEIVFVFRSPESISSLINQLKDAKKELKDYIEKTNKN